MEIKRLLSILTAFVLLFSPTMIVAEMNKLDYVALGDSLAAGQTPIKEQDLGDGYADYLSYQLNEVDVLASFNKEHAKSGYTTDNVLADILDEENVALHKTIAKAEMITISAGANDMLRLIEIDPVNSEVHYDPNELLAGLTQVGENTAAILKEIKKINPQASIYVMGYYNPFPHAPAELQPELEQLLIGLNQAIKDGSTALGATFVPTGDAIGENSKTYIPNPQDIHPDAEGYLVLANSFWNHMDLGQEVEFNDKIPVWAKDEVNLLVKKGLIRGNEDGNFGADDKIKRVHAALILKRGIIYDFKEAPDPGYNDFSATDYGYTTVAKLSEQGIFNGDDKKNFNQGKSLTRAEMAKITVQAYNLKGSSETTFSDVDGHWGEEDISILIANDVVDGFEDGTFRPDEKISRAQLAKVIGNVISRGN